MRRAAAALGWVALTLVVSCERPRTELVVRVDSEVPWGAGQTVQSVVLTVRRGGATGPLRSARTTPLGDGGERRSLPLLVGVVPGDDDDTDTPVWIEALGCRSPNGCDVAGAAVVQRAVVRFARGQTQELTLLLASACLNVACPSDQRCAVATGMCEPATRAQEMVRPFSVADAAVVDAAVADAGNDVTAPDVVGIDVVDAGDAVIADQGTSDDRTVALDAPSIDAVVPDDRSMSDDRVDVGRVIDSMEIDVGSDAADASVRDAPPVDVPSIDLGSAIDCAMTDATCASARDGSGGDGTTGDGGMCVASGRACTPGSTTCCGDYSCAQQAAGTLCCHPAMGSCANSLDCCGQMLCNIASGQTTGSCVCRRRNEVCINNPDCCGGATCNRPDGGTSGTCVCSIEFATCTSSEGCCDGLSCRNGRCLTAGCLAPGERCDNTDAGSCCGGYGCNLQPSGQSTCSRGPALVESDPPTTCMSAAECAGATICTGGVCVCRRGGQSCFYANDCCGAMLCVRPGGAPSMGTCQCQSSGNGCRIGGNDCCSGACRSTPTGDRCP